MKNANLIAGVSSLVRSTDLALTILFKTDGTGLHVDNNARENNERKILDRYTKLLINRKLISSLCSHTHQPRQFRQLEIDRE